MVKDGTAKELATLRREKKAAVAKGRTKEQADYCNAIGVLLSNAGRLDEALEEHREELALCQALEDSIGEAVAHRRLGEVYCELGQLDEALSHHRLFLAAAERQQDRLELQRATATVGRTYLLQADNISYSQGESKNELLSLANTYFERSLKVVPSVTGISDGERAEMMARLYLNIGIVAEAAGDPDRARTAYDKASSLTERHGLHEVGRRVHDALALSLQTAGDQEGALEHLRTSLRLAERTADPAARADALHGLAQAHLLMSNLDEASRTWYKAYRLRSPRQDEHKRHVRCLRYAVRLSRAADQLAELPADDQYKTRHDLHEQMGDCYCRLMAYRPALQHYQNQLECAEKLGSSESTKAAIYASLAETHRDLRQYDRAKHWFMKELDARQGNPTEVCKTLMNLASLETAMGGDVDSVCEWYRRAASEASLAGLARLRAAALRDLADTYAEHGRGEDEQRTRRDLALALRADHLPETDEGEGEDSDAESSSSGGSELDAETLEGLQEESEETELPELQSRRPRRGGGTLWRNNKGETHLHVACIQGRMKQAERLLIGGHPVNARDHSGWLPLHEAANFGHAPLVELLLKHGAHVNDPGGRHCGGVTPLHDAGGNGHVAAARQLLAAGADPGAANENGQTPLQYLMHFMSQLDSGGESMSDLRELRQEMTDILRARGAPIPPSPSARLSQSASAQSGRSSPTLEDDSEETPLLPITISDDTEESPASAYRRAIRSVGQSAVNAPAPQAVLAARQQRQRTSDSPKSGLVSEDQYQWLEEDMPSVPRPRRRRRLSAVMAAAGGADRQRTMSPPPASGGVRPVSPLTGPDDEDSALHGRTQEIISSSPEESRPTAAHQSQSAPGTAGGGETPDERRRPAKRQRMTTLEFEHPPQPSRVASRSPSPPAPTPQRGSSSSGWSSGTLRVFVQVESDRLMVPVPLAEAGGAGRTPHTVQWLADRAADRYYQQFLLRPRLELLKDGALLAAEDAVQGLVSGQEDVLGSRVLGWERPPLAERYTSVCAQLNQRPLRAVSARLALAQTSSRLELTELRLTPERLQPVLRAAERYGCVLHLLLAGNPLREPGARQLCAALPHLSGLQTLDLSGTQLSAAGLSRLATAAGQQQALRSCTTLLLGHNLFSADHCAGSLAELISGLPRLSTLDLTACQLTERHLRADDGALCRALAASQLTHLRLSHNEVRGRGAERLLSALRPDWLLVLSLAGWRGVPAALGDYVARARDCCLQELDLRHSRITDDQAQLMATALTGCRHLARLDLSHNSGLSGRGVSGLLAAGCPLTRLSVAGCSATGPWLDPLLETSPDAPPLSLTVPAALLSGRAAGTQVTPDGDVTLQLPVESAGRLTAVG